MREFQALRSVYDATRGIKEPEPVEQRDWKTERAIASGLKISKAKLTRAEAIDIVYQKCQHRSKKHGR